MTMINIVSATPSKQETRSEPGNKIEGLKKGKRECNTFIIDIQAVSKKMFQEPAAIVSYWHTF